MPWYDYLLCFFGGSFIANFVPHFVRGISGTQFPTPFASPPGRGLSSPTLNVLWALVNLIAGFLLLQFGAFSLADWQLLVTSFAGFTLMSVVLSRVFDIRADEKLSPRKVSGPPPDDKAPAGRVFEVRPPDDKPHTKDLRAGL